MTLLCLWLAVGLMPPLWMVVHAVTHFNACERGCVEDDDRLGAACQRVIDAYLGALDAIVLRRGAAIGVMRFVVDLLLIALCWPAVAWMCYKLWRACR